MTLQLGDQGRSDAHLVALEKIKYLLEVAVDDEITSECVF
jgi:hypothetical protein